jgi:hypothetical protein
MVVSGWKWFMISLISRKALTLAASEPTRDRLDSAA